MDVDALNYDPSANVASGDCVLPTLGCTYTDACNFEIEASEDDGSCDWACYGCMDIQAVNYDEEATTDDSSCFYSDDNNQNTELCAGDIDSDGIVGISDLLLVLSGFGFVCE